MANPAPLPNATGLGAPNPQRLALDNLIRRELKVGDPSDPMQIAQALLDRYQGDPRATAIAQEARGLPFLQAAPLAAPVLQQAASSGAEWTQACDDIERDLACLATDAILKDVMPELRGWTQAIRSCLQEGYNSARLALDPHNRDKAFAMRRQLNDFARLSRLIGSHTPTMIAYYRSLAKSLDEASNLLLVIMGEALANIGFGGGRYLPQVPYTELQTRRDAAIYALRNLVGSTQMAYGPEDWPRGLDAYRQLTDLLEAQGQNDLRSLLVEGELARTMDELVQRGSDATSDGLRAVGSTALLALERFRRLVALGRRSVSPESPALYAYLEALQLFADSFESAGGFRLMKIARPPILFYGLYGNNGMDDADRRLVEMITRRSLLADRIDCIASTCCALPGQRVGVVMLDKVLYDIDRAVDLYALGFENFGQTERRAAAFGYLIAAVGDGVVPEAKLLIDNDAELKQNLTALADADLRPALLIAKEQAFDAVVGQLVDRASAELDLIQTHGIKDQKDIAKNLAIERDKLVDQRAQGAATVKALTSLYTAISSAEDKLLTPNQIEIEADLDTDGYIGVLEQELCLQREMETRWDNLVHSMVPNCSSLEYSLKALVKVVDHAMQTMLGDTCATQAPINLPPTLETSFDTLIERVERTGLGRPNRVFALQRRRT
ncbi:MAG TPA: hypothetical protein VGQ23_02885 [Burkholderiaceae bacterium]|jgi:hypothetical protein|nr:hypothetical protein [Burkholderiaceae bacterium]